MKFIIALSSTLIVSLAINLYDTLPWWTFAIGVGITNFFIPIKPHECFLSAFLGVFISWFLTALYIDFQNNQILSKKISILFFNTPQYTILLIILSASIGGLVAGFSGITANYIKKIFKK